MSFSQFTHIKKNKEIISQISIKKKKTTLLILWTLHSLYLIQESTFLFDSVLNKILFF